jgi:hypothetical protein
MLLEPSKLINIVLALVALSFYIIGSRRFYLDRPGFAQFLILAIFFDGLAAVLASFGITPTTQLPYSDFVPWRSKLFLAHVILASIGFFGFIAIMVTVLARGTHRPYRRMRRWQYRILLPVWLVGEGIALVNSLGKVLFRIRLYDYL